jgi:hypothetical protein
MIILFLSALRTIRLTAYSCRRHMFPVQADFGTCFSIVEVGICQHSVFECKIINFSPNSSFKIFHCRVRSFKALIKVCFLIYILVHWWIGYRIICVLLVGNYLPYWDVCGWKLRAVLGCLWLEVTCRIGMSVVGSYLTYWDVCSWKLRAVLWCLVDCVRLFLVFCGV